jgi:predicted hydrocarbon binding protein
MINYAIAPASLHHLRRRLLAAGPGLAAEVLQDAGIATGEALSSAWATRVSQRTGLADAGRLDASWFGEIFAELCREAGWGVVTVDRVADRAVLFSSRDWREAESGASAHPGCYFTCGCLAAFLTAQAGAALAVLEVECRSCGAEQCRFLAGSTATLGAVYDLIAAGGPWREAFQSSELPT